VTSLLAVPAMAMVAGLLALLFHPLLRFLQFPEVPGAVAALLAGPGQRRRLRFILRSRREAYLECCDGLPAGIHLVSMVLRSYLSQVTRWLRFRAKAAREHGPLVAPPKEKTLLRDCPVHGRELLSEALARALQVPPGSVSVSGTVVSVITDRDYNRGGQARVRSFEDILCPVHGEEAARRARLEQDWEDIR
jgi:hypothetical protein